MKYFISWVHFSLKTYIRWLLVVCCLVQLGCGTIFINGQRPSRKEKVLAKDFLSKSKITVKDSQVSFFVREVTEPELRRFFGDVSGGTTHEVSIDLPVCKVSKRFWETSYNILSMFVLTLGEIQECKARMNVVDSHDKSIKVYESTSEHYVFTGLLGILAGPFMLPAFYNSKINRVESVVVMYGDDQKTNKDNSQAKLYDLHAP